MKSEDEILPEWSNLALEESSYDENLDRDWAFMQEGFVDRDMRIDENNKEIIYNVAEKEGHIYK